jgi:hypothetical protein
MTHNHLVVAGPLACTQERAAARIHQRIREGDVPNDTRCAIRYDGTGDRIDDSHDDAVPEVGCAGLVRNATRGRECSRQGDQHDRHDFAACHEN